MDDDWSIVYEHSRRQACDERALVLHSLGIPYQLASDEARIMLLVPAASAEKAKYELWQYEQENRGTDQPQRSPLPIAQNGIPGAVFFVVIVCAVAWLAGQNAFGLDWFAAGRVDGELIREGQWWRAITALTLHSGIRHLLGNIAFGVFFGLLAGRLLGSGVTWLAVLLSATAANGLNTLLLDSTHRSVGASTAVFAALGLIAGFVWRSKLMAQDRWAYRLGPIVGGMALLAYTGTGDADTDIGAHLLGFGSGFTSGMLLSRVSARLSGLRLQQVSGAVAVLIIALAWVIAL
jgi:membrane associated rhomboid family serine protease